MPTDEFRPGEGSSERETAKPGEHAMNDAGDAPVSEHPSSVQVPGGPGSEVRNPDNAPQTLGIRDYLEATADSSKRTRTVAHTIVVASVLFLAALLNCLHHNWMLYRIQACERPDSEYVRSIIGAQVPPADPGHQQWKDRYNSLHSSLVRAYAESSLIVRVPFFGISFDVNLKGPLGGITFSILLVMMRFCLSRELDNIRLVFQQAKVVTESDVMYQLLAMRQVFTVPPGTTIHRTRFLLVMPKIYITSPLIVHLATTLHDISTRHEGYKLSTELTYTVIIVEIFLLLFLFILTYMCLTRLFLLDRLWENQQSADSSANKELELDAIYEVLSHRDQSSQHDLAERHDEHQP